MCVEPRAKLSVGEDEERYGSLSDASFCKVQDRKARLEMISFKTSATSLVMGILETI